MSKLTEHIVLSRTRAQDLNSVRKLNCWGSDLKDVQVVRNMSFVEVLSLSVNAITTLEDFSYCRNLQELYLRKNNIKDLNEVIYLKNLPHLRSLWLADNPCSEGENYRLTVLRALPNLEMLDNIFVQPEEVVKAKTQGALLIDPSEPINGDLKSPDVHSPSQVSKAPPGGSTKHVQENQYVETECPPRNVALQATSPVNPQIPSSTVTPSSTEPHLPEEKQITPNRHQESVPNEDEELFETPPTHLPNSKPQNANSDLSPQHQHAFHARVQTLVDHSGRRLRKASDINCPKDGCMSPPDGKAQSVHGDSPVGNERQFSGDPDDTAASGDGYRIPLVDGQEMSFVQEFSYSSEQRSQVLAQSTPRSEKSMSQLLPKGGRNRNSNILSAVLCLVKELDYASLEVVETAIHCRMEEMDD